MGSHKKILHYAQGIDKEKSTDDATILRFKSVKIETSSTKHYNNHLHLLYQLSKVDRLLLDYILQEMSTDNFISNTSTFKQRFLQTLTDLGISHTYSKNTINKSFGELKRVFILVKERDSGRGLYRVNPLYFWKGTERKRTKLLRRMRESKFLTENNQVRRDYYEKKDPTKK